MVGQKRRDTAPELAIRHILHRRGYRYWVDRTVLPASRRRHDLVFSRARVVVEIRGCFWHACPQHGTYPKANQQWWADKLARNVARDTDTKRQLEAAGWQLVVVWEHEDPASAAERVAELVDSRR